MDQDAIGDFFERKHGVLGFERPIAQPESIARRNWLTMRQHFQYLACKFRPGGFRSPQRFQVDVSPRPLERPELRHFSAQ